jgi:orotate phosphoribosyltransferase
MKNYKAEFIDNAIASGALKFGEFTLKSGRVSPYFFNAGEFHRGSVVASLGRCYAEAIVESGIEFDMLFGPAYKGITLTAATSIALSERHRIDVPFCFNRKEAKSHGEGGSLVGAPLQGRVLIIDDVITAGTAIREVMAIVQQTDAEVSGVLIGLDRKERGRDKHSAIEEVQQQHGVSVVSIITIEDILHYLNSKPDTANLVQQIESYRDQYGS